MKNSNVLIRRAKTASGSDDSIDLVNLIPNSLIGIDSLGVAECYGQIGLYTSFVLLPAAAAAVTADPYFITIGTGTETQVRSDRGGATFGTAAGTGPDTQALVGNGSTSLPNSVKILAGAAWEFRTRVCIDVITVVRGIFGFDELIDATHVTPGSTAGDGAYFAIDPANASVAITATSAAQAAYWLCCEKVNGTDYTWVTDVPIQAGIDVDLQITIGQDLRPTFRINGVVPTMTPTGSTAVTTYPLTSGDTMKLALALQTDEAVLKTYQCRFVRLSRVCY